MPSEKKDKTKEPAAAKKAVKEKAEKKPAKEKPVKEKAEKKPAKKKRNRDREITIILSSILAALTIAGLILFFIMPDPYADIPETQQISEVPEPEEIPEPDDEPIVIPTPPVIVYPAPAYDFTEEEVWVEAPGIKHEYTIAWVSDVHMITDLEPGDVCESSLETVLNRYETLSVTADGIHGKDLWPMIIDYLNYRDFDAVIFGGDILDYCSTSNMLALEKGFSRLKYPEDRILYIRADHDYGVWYSDGSTGFDDYRAADLHIALDGDDYTRKYIDFGDLIIAGVNRSIKKPGEEQMTVLTELYSRGVPVIAATHVPYYSQVDPSLEELSMLVRNRIYYWDPSSETYGIDADMQKYLDLIYAEDSPCVEVLAGHLHAAWEGEIREGLEEHIFSPAFMGVIGVVHVIPEGESH
ncbi:MAG: metallophosphoesterase [Lachnospiraceae bacterium]|nr:metallophosphoesterase [Lachnospiraceae bacterium]